MFGVNLNTYYICDNFKQVNFFIIIEDIGKSYKMKPDLAILYFNLIQKKMKKKFLFLAMSAFVAFSCSDDDDPSSIEVTGISVTPSTATIYQEQTALPTLSAAITPENADDPTITWSSNNTAYLTVNNKGVLTLVKDIDADATVTITAKAANGKTGTCTVQLKACLEGGYKVIDATDEIGLLILDRNIGATEPYNNNASEPNAAAVGNYYQFGKNTPVAQNDDTNVNSSFNTTWNATGTDYKDWNVSENTPCPAGWRIPNQAETKRIVDATFWDWDFVDMGMMTEEELMAAKALQEKILIARGGLWKLNNGTVEKYLPEAACFWSNEINTTNTDEAKLAYAYVDNLFATLDKKQPVVNALPIRCVKSK